MNSPHSERDPHAIPAPLLAGGVPGDPEEPGLPPTPSEPGEPTLPDQPPPIPVA
ncbi:MULTISPECIES: hypothetical protein [Pseudomonas]|uniref:hypothetical protein n=1 Tax=Pseudomonas TaxID=286 RepID=UPI0023540C14|nr:MULTISPECIES: hypothetical protein [Pseudomonas]